MSKNRRKQMTETRISRKERLLKQQKQIKQELNLIFAKEKKEKRVRENNIKFMLGGTILRYLKDDPAYSSRIVELIQKYGRKQDKTLLEKHGSEFGLAKPGNKSSSISSKFNKTP